MSYTVEYCDKFMDELLDKMGSDFFPRPIKLRRFESVTLQFIRETTAFLEATQEISDDIVDLVVSLDRSLVNGKTHSFMGKPFYKIVYPSDYIRLLNVFPIAKKGFETDFEVKLYKLSNLATNLLNPFRKAEEGRVNIYRIDGSAIIDTNIPLQSASFMYVKKPTFGVNSKDIMVNMGDLMVDRLMQKTCVSLKATSSDSDTVFMDEYVERQGQKTK